MIRALRKRLSRRRFFALVGGLIGSVLTACSSESSDETDGDSGTPAPSPTQRPEPEPTATPRPSPTAILTPTPAPPSTVRYWIDPGVENASPALIERFAEAVRQSAGEQALEPEVAKDELEADVVARLPGNSENDVIVYGDPLIPVVSVDQYAGELSRDQVESLLNGSIANWLEVGGQDRTVVPAVHPSAVASGIDTELQIVSAEELRQLAAENPGILALVPRSLVSFHVMSIYVGEVDPLRDELAPDSWAWWERVAVSFGRGAGTLERQALTEELEEINAGAVAPRRMMLSAVGDVMLGRTVHTIMTRQGDWRAPYHLVVDELQRGDITIGNLECAITGSFAPPEDPRTFSFMTFPAAAEGLSFAGFNALSGANNHAMDFGLVGAQDTAAALAEHGIQHFGAGENLASAREPCLLEHDGITYALLGYDSISMNYAGATAETGGIAPMLQEYVVEDIQSARENADVVIPFFHWGVEYTLTPTASDRQMAHAAIDAGADLVLGGHPHWVQGMEIYQDRPIFYSLANFVFDQEWSLETKQGFVLHLIFDRATFVGYRVTPVLIEEFYRPRVVEDDHRATILGRFWESSRLIAVSSGS